MGRKITLTKAQAQKAQRDEICKMVFGLIKASCCKNGITQKDVAKRIGKHHDTWYGWNSDEDAPLQKISFRDLLFAVQVSGMRIKANEEKGVITLEVSL